MKTLLRHLEVKDLKETRQRQTVGNRLSQLEKKKKEIQEQEDKEFLEPFKSDWRSTLTESEWITISGSGPTNSASQTFGYYVDGDLQTNVETGEPITYTVSGLGGIESVPTTTTIDYGFGDVSTVDAPTYNQLAMQGYAKPLGFNVNRRTDYRDVNPLLDASQEFAQRVGADYMMNARVQQTIRQEVETDLTKIAAKFDSSLIENMGQNVKLAVEAIMNGQQPPLVAPPDPPFTGMSHEQMVDETNKVNDKYNKLLEPLQKELDSYAGQLAPAGLVAKINALVEKQSQETNALYEKNLKDNQEYGDLLAKRADEWGKFVNAIEDYRKGFNLKSPSQEVAQVAGPFDSILDKVADKFKVGTAKNFLDYYINNFVAGKEKQNQNLTGLLSKSDYQYLQRMLSSSLTGSKIENPQGTLDGIMASAPLGIRNSLGNNTKIDVQYYKDTGDFKLTKDYVFTEYDDFGGRADGNLLSHLMSVGTMSYTQLSALSALGPKTNLDPLINNPMRYHVIIKNNRKKKQNESTTWNRIKKHLKGA